MFWYTQNLGTCNYYDYESLNAVKNPEVGFVMAWDLIDGEQKDWNLFLDRVKQAETIIKSGKKAIIVCLAGVSRSNAVVLAVFLRQGLDWYDSNEIIHKNPESKIEENLKNQIKIKLT